MNERQIKIDIGYAVEVMLRRIAGSSWCYCHEIVDLLSVSEAALIARTNPRTIFTWI